MNEGLVYARRGPWLWIKLPNGNLIRMPFVAMSRKGLRGWARQELEAISDSSDGQKSQTFFATVAPVMACDLGCSYCIQNLAPAQSSHRPVRVPVIKMNTKVLRESVAFIERQMQAQGKNSLDLLIFGGEPLLDPELCYQLLDMTTAIGLERAEMVTNATRLGPEVAANLEAKGLRRIQVTFDGFAADHDSVRVTRRGEGTYSLIRSNVAAAQRSTGIAFKVRANLTMRNLDGIPRLLVDLANHLEPRKTEIEFAPVDDIGVGFSDVVVETDRLVHDMAGMYEMAAELGFRVKAPMPSSCQYCGPEPGLGGAVINADGTLYSSWDNLGRLERRAGHVGRGYDAKAIDRWTACGEAASYDRSQRLRVMHRLAQEILPLELSQLSG